MIFVSQLVENINGDLECMQYSSSAGHITTPSSGTFSLPSGWLQARAAVLQEHKSQYTCMYNL